MVAAMPVGIHQQRIESPLFQFFMPAERGLGVGFGECRFVFAVLVDIDQEPLACAVRRDRVQPDQIALVIAAIVLFDDLDSQCALAAAGLFAGAV